MDQEIRKKVLENIIPTKEENRKIQNLINNLIKATWEILEDKDFSVKFIEAEGSTGMKQTHLSGDSDIDLFIALDFNNYKEFLEFKSKIEMIKELKKLFLKLCNEIFKPVLRKINAQNISLTYAEHPYITANLNSYLIDMVGCFDLSKEFLEKNGPITAVDRTPHHSKFIKNNLTDEMRNDVRILKAFFRSSHIYGDKSAIGRFGFTGFASELLIYYFNNIDNLFDNISNLPNFPQDCYNRPINKLKQYKRFKDDYFILIDPIDKNRNVASSISKRAFKHMVRIVSKYRQNPSVDFFIKKEIPAKVEINKKDKDKFVVIELKSDGSRHYTEVRDKLYKFSNTLKTRLEFESTREPRFSKTLFEVYFEGLDFAIVFYTNNNTISEYYKRKGPPIDNIENFEKFKTKHPNFFIENNIAYVMIKREFTSPIDLILSYTQNKKLFSGIKIINISNLGVSKIGKKALYIMKEMVIPIELDR
ncbi:MAG: hypothetical protein ACTSPY_13600 [Candidatus Helarchaeota archaeon]